MWDFQYLQGKLIALLVFFKVINSFLKVESFSLLSGQPEARILGLKRDLVFQKDKES
jgi:hypothetical protein